MTRTEKQAQFLSISDKLATGDTVTTSAYRGLKTPSGKVDLGINGFKKTWCKNTLITIITE